MVSYLIFFITVAAILSIATLGLNLQWGVSGQFNAGVVGFLAVGAYSMAILTMPESQQLLVKLNWPFAVGIVGSLVVSGAIALLVGLATLRLRSDYLAIATFGIASSIQVLANNLEPLTGGSRGLVGIPRPFESLGAQGFGYAYLAIVLGVLVIVYAGLQALLRSPWGRVQRALREDEVVCAALGKNVVRFRMTAFVMGAMLMGLSGALYAGFIGTTSPTEFLPILTFQIWAMLIVGGSGSNAGAIAGTFVIWGLWTLSGAAIVSVLPPQWQAQGGALQSILVGLVLVLTLLLRPQGLLGPRRAA
ncbi:MAG: branched-chain amino acid ABC transporter permease [Polaromonas sp.]|uniref:branched-chain amino acid ABC transporter permease n=1 Tax=Polaromonas sp. TaxID=1869339 RepID=UPI00403668D6|nr:branched-chain amino acid ABC transporter permease [Polaromonas sp.]